MDATTSDDQRRIFASPEGGRKVFSILSPAQENIYSKASEMHVLKLRIACAFKWSTSEIVGPCSCLEASC